jgi:hypothetical protein
MSTSSQRVRRRRAPTSHKDQDTSATSLQRLNIWQRAPHSTKQQQQHTPQQQHHIIQPQQPTDRVFFAIFLLFAE